MISILLANGSSIIIKIDEITLIKSHGNKSLIYINNNEFPFCSSFSLSEIQCIIYDALKRRIPGNWFIFLDLRLMKNIEIRYFKTPGAFQEASYNIYRIIISRGCQTLS